MSYYMYISLEFLCETASCSSMSLVFFLFFSQANAIHWNKSAFRITGGNNEVWIYLLPRRQKMHQLPQQLQKQQLKRQRVGWCWLIGWLVDWLIGWLVDVTGCISWTSALCHLGIGWFTWACVRQDLMFGLFCFLFVFSGSCRWSSCGMFSVIPGCEFHVEVPLAEFCLLCSCHCLRCCYRCLWALSTQGSPRSAVVALQAVGAFWEYHRPNLKWITITTVLVCIAYMRRLYMYYLDTGPGMSSSKGGECGASTSNRRICDVPRVRVPSLVTNFLKEPIIQTVCVIWHLRLDVVASVALVRTTQQTLTLK